MKEKSWVRRAKASPILLLTLLLLSGCMATTEIREIPDVAASKPPFSAHLEPSSLNWLYTKGGLRYGMTTPEVRESLENAGDMCGMVFRLQSFDSVSMGPKTDLMGLYSNPLQFHGKPFHGDYYWLIGDDAGSKLVSKWVLALNRGRAAFLLSAYPLAGQWAMGIAYLPGDTVIHRMMWSLQQEEVSKYPYGKARLKALQEWLPREKKLANYLHQPHSLQEVKGYCYDLLTDANRGSWTLLVQPFKESDWGTSGSDNGYYDYIYCVRGSIHPSKMLILRTASESMDTDASYLFSPKEMIGDAPAFNWAHHYTQDYFHAYFNSDDHLVGVSMFVHEMPILNPILEHVDRYGEYYPNDVLEYWPVTEKEK